MIILDNKNIKIKRLSKSLNYKNLKSYKVIKVINNIIYKLNLLNELNIYLIFYSWLLYLNNNDLLSS